jgi:hypothetical protein
MDECPLAWSKIDPTVPVQQLKRLSDGDPADAQSLSEPGFDQMLSGLQGSVDDEFFQPLVDLLTQGSRCL